MTAQKEKNLLSVGTVSKKLGVSISTLRRWDNAGKLKSLRTPGNQRRYRKTQVLAFLNGRPTENYELRITNYGKKVATPLASSPRHNPSVTQYLSHSVTPLDPHQLLYMAITAIVTVQLLHLAILKIPQVQASMNAAAKAVIHNTQSFMHHSNQRAFARAFFSGLLYSGTHHYQSFAQKSNRVSTQGTYLLAATALQAGKNLKNDMGSQMFAARSNLFPETDPTSTALAQENLAQPTTVLGTQVEDPERSRSIEDTEPNPNTQNFIYGSILIDPHQSQITVNFKTPKPLTQVPVSVITTPSYLTQTALTDVTPQGFTVILGESSPQPQTLYWLALW